MSRTFKAHGSSRAPALTGENLVYRFHGGRAGAPSAKANGRYRTGRLTEAERETWLTAPWTVAKKLQRPLADRELKIVHRTALK